MIWHLGKIFPSLNLGGYLKHDSRAKDQNGNYIKFGNEEIDTTELILNYNGTNEKMDSSDYDFKNRAMEFLLKTSVR